MVMGTKGLSLILLMLAVCGNGCSNIIANTPTTSSTKEITVTPDQEFVSSPTASAVEETPVENMPHVSNLIGGILSHPDQYLGQQVEIVGFYRGWNLLKEVQGSPPVTRSDWVIADNSGAIYVTGIIPRNLDPASRQDTNQIVCLVATVEQNQNGVYLQAISVELIH